MDKRASEPSPAPEGSRKRMKAMQQSPAVTHLPLYKHVKNNVYERAASGQHDTWIVYDSSSTFCMLEPRPSSDGHLVVVCKEAAATLLEPISDAALLAGAKDVQAVARAVQQVTRCAGIKVQQLNGPAAGQTVPQLHYHILPCYEQPGWALKEGSMRTEVEDAQAGRLVAAVRNTLPGSYSPGFHHWAGSVDEMEALGHVIQAHLCKPGHAVLLSGQLGAGKSTIARGIVRAFCGDPQLDVPSPTFLLCLTYEDDLAHDDVAKARHERPARVHHMDPYRLGKKTDRLSGLLDWEAALGQDVCLIEWPDRMPTEVMALAKQGVNIQISGYGSQGAGRLVSITALPGDTASAALLDQWRSQGLPTADATWRSQHGPANTLSNSSMNGSTTGATQSGPQLPSNPAEWVVLGIESSCDDTAAAVVRGDGTILAHEIASQAGVHEQWGGVKPDAARDAHAAAIVGTVQACLSKAGVAAQDLTAVAVTVGPGLSLCLQVGVKHALTLAAQQNKPVVPVHHMEAHTLMARMPSVNSQPLSFPALLLLVSGGHNMLVLCSGVGKYRILGTTLDDSVGECFDKTARLLGFAHIPGGPLLEKLSLLGKPVHKITMPMQNGAHKDSCNFSFSGLKTSVARLIEDVKAKLGVKDCNISLSLAADGTSIQCSITTSVAAPVETQPAMSQAVQPGTEPVAMGAGTSAVMAGGSCNQGAATATSQTGQPGEELAAEGLQPTTLQTGQPCTAQAAVGAGTVPGTEPLAAENGADAVMAGESCKEGAAIATSHTAMQVDADAAIPTHNMPQDADGAAQRTAKDVNAVTQKTAQDLSGVAQDTVAGRCSEEVKQQYVQQAADIAASFAQVAVRFLQQRTARALEWLQEDCRQQGSEPITCLVVAGGVAANAAVRAGLQEVATRFNIPCICPPVKYCTDNGLMVAWTGVERLKLGLWQMPPAPGKVENNVDVLPRWPLGPVDPRSAAAVSLSKIYH